MFVEYNLYGLDDRAILVLHGTSPPRRSPPAAARVAAYPGVEAPSCAFSTCLTCVLLQPQAVHGAGRHCAHRAEGQGVLVLRQLRQLLRVREALQRLPLY